MLQWSNAATIEASGASNSASPMRSENFAHLHFGQYWLCVPSRARVAESFASVLSAMRSEVTGHLIMRWPIASNSLAVRTAFGRMN